VAAVAALSLIFGTLSFENPAGGATATATISGAVRTYLNEPLPSFRYSVFLLQRDPAGGSIPLREWRGLTDGSGRFSKGGLPYTRAGQFYEVSVDRKFYKNRKYFNSYGTVGSVRSPNVANQVIYVPTGRWDYFDTPGGTTALGDSFTSGEGNAPFDIQWDNNPQCHRSYASYFSQFFKLVNTSISDSKGLFGPRNASCTEAKVADLYQGFKGDPSSQLFGQLGVADEAGDAQYNNLTSWTDLVTLTIGGNDLRFSWMLAACMALTRCDTIIGAVPAVVLQDLYGRLVSLYSTIVERASSARILVLGYPRFFSNSLNPLQGCWALFDVFERTWGNAIARSLDSVIRFAVATLNNPRIVYVDTYDAFDGHELCTADSFFHDPTAAGAAKFHPNANGHYRLAQSAANSFQTAPRVDR
jgi:hypothetical protein